MNKYVVKSLEDPTQIGPPDHITATECLLYLQMRLFGFESAQETLEMLGQKKEKRELTDWEKKLKIWRPGYGFLYDYRDRVGFLFPKAHEKDYKHEIIKEYFFHIPDSYFSGVILSLAQEPNSDRPFWGLRRDLATDWPFDGEKTAIRLFSDNSPVKNFVEQMNSLIINLENIIQTP